MQKQQQDDTRRYVNESISGLESVDEKLKEEHYSKIYQVYIYQEILKSLSIKLAADIVICMPNQNLYCDVPYFIKSYF